MALESELPLDALANRCAEETAKYRHQQPSNPLFCFELLRRALAEDLPEAFTYVYTIYEQQVQAWVYRHSRFQQTEESAEFFARWALRTFYFGVRGAKFADFPSLAHLLSYLKRCVHRAISQYLRDQAAPPSVPLERIGQQHATIEFVSGVGASELWAYICGLLPDERDRLLARCALVLSMKPRQILAAYPDRWASEREITVALFRIRRLLRRDKDLRRDAGLADADDD